MILSTTAQKVEQILKENKEARDSDAELIATYAFMDLGLDLTKLATFRAIIEKLPSLETITRARRIIQSQGKYRASDKVLRARKKREGDIVMECNELTAYARI